jgi:hypothetical protein
MLSFKGYATRDTDATELLGEMLRSELVAKCQGQHKIPHNRQDKIPQLNGSSGREVAS